MDNIYFFGLKNEENIQLLLDSLPNKIYYFSDSFYHFKNYSKSKNVKSFNLNSACINDTLPYIIYSDIIIFDFTSIHRTAHLVKLKSYYIKPFFNVKFKMLIIISKDINGLESSVKDKIKNIFP